jgi:hypothetical protein
LKETYPSFAWKDNGSTLTLDWDNALAAEKAKVSYRSAGLTGLKQASGQ